MDLQETAHAFVHSYNFQTTNVQAVASLVPSGYILLGYNKVPLGYVESAENSDIVFITMGVTAKRFEDRAEALKHAHELGEAYGKVAERNHG
jgi:malate/lactate dehydrogenase